MFLWIIYYPLESIIPGVPVAERVETSCCSVIFMCLKIRLLQLRLLSHRGGDELLL
jgi:hypothetical protein